MKSPQCPRWGSHYKQGQNPVERIKLTEHCSGRQMAEPTRRSIEKLRRIRRSVRRETPKRRCAQIREREGKKCNWRNGRRSTTCPSGFSTSLRRSVTAANCIQLCDIYSKRSLRWRFNQPKTPIALPSILAEFSQSEDPSPARSEAAKQKGSPMGLFSSAPYHQNRVVGMTHDFFGNAAE